MGEDGVNCGLPVQPPEINKTYFAKKIKRKEIAYHCNIYFMALMYIQTQN